MYPTISEFLKTLGIDLPLPIQTFGFFVALAFIAAAMILGSELRRKKREGLLKPTFKKVMIGKPATTQDYILQGLLGFVIGFKLFYLIGNYGLFVDDPQGSLLSTDGSFLGGLVVAAIMIYLRFRESESQKKLKQEVKTITMEPEAHLGNIIMLGVVGGLIGAKIFHNLENPSEFFRDPIGALFSFSGLTFYGGLIVATVLILRYAKKNGIDRWHLVDAAAPALMFSYGIGRIGCHASGDGDWGIVNLKPKPDWLSWAPDWMWSFKYPHNVNHEGIPIPGCTGKWCYELPDPVYPTSFYEFLLATIIFIVLWGIRKKITTPGLLFSIYLVFNGLERFSIEKIRVNEQYHLFGMGITQAEIISFLLILTGLAGIWYTRKFNKKTDNGDLVTT